MRRFPSEAAMIAAGAAWHYCDGMTRESSQYMFIQRGGVREREGGGKITLDYDGTVIEMLGDGAQRLAQDAGLQGSEIKITFGNRVHLGRVPA